LNQGHSSHSFHFCQSHTTSHPAALPLTSVMAATPLITEHRQKGHSAKLEGQCAYQRMHHGLCLMQMKMEGPTVSIVYKWYRHPDTKAKEALTRISGTGNQCTHALRPGTSSLPHARYYLHFIWYTALTLRNHSPLGIPLARIWFPQLHRAVDDRNRHIYLFASANLLMFTLSLSTQAGRAG
jgi:hypothetical protein